MSRWRGQKCKDSDSCVRQDGEEEKVKKWCELESKWHGVFSRARMPKCRDKPLADAKPSSKGARNVTTGIPATSMFSNYKLTSVCEVHVQRTKSEKGAVEKIWQGGNGETAKEVRKKHQTGTMLKRTAT